MKNTIIISLFVIALVWAPSLRADEVMKQTKEQIAGYLSLAQDQGLSQKELVEFGDRVYGWSPEHYNAALHVIAYHVEREDDAQRTAMLALGAYLQGKWQKDKWTRRWKVVRICAKGGWGTAKHAVVGFYFGGCGGGAVGGLGGAALGALWGTGFGVVLGHLKSWEKISPELKKTIRLKPSKIIDKEENAELAKMMEQGVHFYEETSDAIVYSVDEKVAEDTSAYLGFEDLFNTNEQ